MVIERCGEHSRSRGNLDYYSKQCCAATVLLWESNIGSIIGYNLGIYLYPMHGLRVEMQLAMELDIHFAPQVQRWMNSLSHADFCRGALMMTVAAQGGVSARRHPGLPGFTPQLAL